MCGMCLCKQHNLVEEEKETEEKWLHNIILLLALESTMVKITANTPGTAGGPGSRGRKLAVKSRKTAEKITFFS